jgi:pimeloyl-ACP methyl ester carboxylesterase
MAYWAWGDAAAPRAVVCVHGLARQGRDFDVLARALVERAGGRVRVVCPDVVGRGRSEWLKDPQGYDLRTYVADMLALIGALQAQAPLAELSWVGTSMGGLIGMAIAGTPKLPLPVPVARLVLNDVGPVIQWQALQRIGTYLGNTGRFDTVQQAADALWQISRSFGPHTAAQWLELSEPMVRPLPEGGWTLHYDPAIAVPFRSVTEASAAEGQAALWALYDAIEAPTLLLRGGDSDLLARDTAQAMAARGPCAQVVEFEAVGHAPTLVAPDQVDAVASFLLRP